MFDYLEGRLLRRGPARLTVDVGGVGYDLAVPVAADFGPTDGTAKRRVFVHLAVKDDAHNLYGFPDLDTRTWFRGLLGVRGVGPALALGILSSLPIERLLTALLEDDPKPLVAVKGVGRKTAEQILLDLRDKAPRLAADLELAPAAGPRRTAQMLDAIQALVSIGYSEKEAVKSVDAASEQVDAQDLEALVRTALAR